MSSRKEKRNRRRRVGCGEAGEPAPRTSPPSAATPVQEPACARGEASPDLFTEALAAPGLLGRERARRETLTLPTVQGKRGTRAKYPDDGD